MVDAPAKGSAEELRLPESVDVAVIGAGIAGLACAARLVPSGCSVLVLEAEGRVGGRACTVEVGGYMADAGAGWLHGTEGNPLVDDGVLSAEDLVPCSARNIWTEGPADGDDSNFHPEPAAVERWRSRFSGGGAAAMRDDSWTAEDERLLRAFELWFGAPVEALDVSGLVPGERHGDYPGPHAVVRGGMATVAARLLERAEGAGAGRFRLALNSEVVAVDETEEGATLRVVSRKAAGGAGGDGAGVPVRCGWVVCTVALGALKASAGGLAIAPPLPRRLTEAVERLEMSQYEKCIFVVREQVAEALPTWTWTDHAHFPMAFNYWKVLRKPIVTCTTCSPGINNMDDSATVAAAMAALGLGPDDVLDHHLTRWRRNPRTRGAYSFSPVGGDPCDIDQFRFCMRGRRLAFAGEHAHEQQGAVHAAYLSGQLAADDIRESLVRANAPCT
mmetsp:Transcript_107868/g.310776  ORF Transcript_107868/g.310776 Transcript_107868/m.310776 type:complete len:446 (-) Transcript_107868:80-1417(-)